MQFLVGQILIFPRKHSANGNDHKKNWIGFVRGEGMMKEITEGKFDGRKGRGRNRMRISDYLKKVKYVYMKRKADDRQL